MNYTKEEHYVPKYHLRNFSNDKKTIYLYDVHNNKNFGRVPIKSLFKETNLYEIKTDDDEFFERNRVEAALSKKEEEHSRLIESIVQRIESSCKKESESLIISQEEVVALAGILSMQVFRMPKELEEFVDKAKAEMTKRWYLKKYPSYTAKDIVYQGCLAPRKEDERQFSVPPFPGVLQLFLMFRACSIGYAENENVITGNCPYCSPNGDKTLRSADSKIGSIVFPLTSKIVLCFHPLKFFKQRHRKLFILDNDDVLEVNRRIAKNSNLICSKKELTDKELAEITQP